MFVIVSYDVSDRRVSKVHKILKRYLQWTQNSVFEGEITEGKLKQCMAEVTKKLDPKVDSLYIYRVPNPKNIEKVVYGVERDFQSIFL